MKTTPKHKYAGICYKCGEMVVDGKGRYKRLRGNWRTEHFVCGEEST